METQQHPWLKNYPAGINWNKGIPPKWLPDFFDAKASEFSDRVFLNFLGREWTYGESLDIINTLAGALQKIGVTKDIKVGLFLPNTPYSVWFYYAILKAGGCVVNYNPLYTQSELHHQIEDSHTDIIVTADLEMLFDKMDDLLIETRLSKLIICPFADILPFHKSVLFKAFKRKDRAHPDFDHDTIFSYDALLKDTQDITPVDIDPLNDTAILQYTGGTTGRPKGAMLTHQNVYSNAAQVGAWVAPLIAESPQQKTMVGVLPFFHVFAMTAVMNMSIYHGMRILLQPNFDLKKVMKLVDKEKPEFFAGVPAIYNAIAKSPDIDGYDFSSLMFCISGGAPLPQKVKDLFTEKTNCEWLAEGYGLTESSPVATCNPVRGDVKIGTIGIPLPDTIIEIINKDDKKTAMPIGEAGEICIKGPQVMKGYYNVPEATADCLKDGRLYTGDIGIMDENGYVRIVDRIKDLILVRGYNVYPSKIEDAIYTHPAIEECIVAGVPDEERGETVWAWVKLRDGETLTAEALSTFLEDPLSPIEKPRKIIIRDKELPKTPVGKLSRKMLLEEEGLKK